MKKILSTLVSICMVLSCYNVFAERWIPDERGPNAGTSTDSSIQIDTDGLSKEEIFDKIEEYYKLNREISEQDYRNAMTIVEYYNETMSVNSGISTYSYDEGAAQLRAGNLIELTLDINEGVSSSKALAAIRLASDAKSEASSKFPNTEDAARHFIWNYKMANKYDATTARTVGVNHEWGLVMITPMLNHYKKEYNNFIDSGCSGDEASQRALANTVLYIPDFKYLSVTVMKKNYNYFNSMFSNDCIMDFWNNCYGRAYVQKGYSSGITAFAAAKNAGELILYSSNVSNDNRWSVWDWDWYSF